VGEWTVVGNGTAPDGAVLMSVADFVTVLSELRDRLVPFIGAGLAAEAGAPSGDMLISELTVAAGEREPASTELFSTADRLAQTKGEAWVQQRVAEIVGAAPLRPTPPLMALAKTATRLIVTTNYDDAVEVSARAVGLAVVSATLKDFRAVLDPPDGTLVVLHLHGVVADPDSIVLTEDSYRQIRSDEVAQLVLRARGIPGRLMFVGHSLDEREEHIHRDVAWTTTAGIPRGEQRHLAIWSVPDLTDTAVAHKAESLADLGLRVFVFPDPARTYEAVRLAAAVTAGRSSVQDEHVAEALRDDDAHYVPHAVGPAEALSDAGSRGAYMAHTWQYGDRFSPDLDETEHRLLLVGGGGYGKSRELREVARRADRPALYLRLGGVTPPIAGASAEAMFVRWMDKAACVKSNPSPKLTLDRLREESFVLLLDGLDEVRADLRASVLSVVNAVVEACPQHRWVVASRPVPDIADLSRFAPYTFAPDSGWLSRYAQGRSVDLAKLDGFLARAPGVNDLMDIPVFAISVVDELAGGREPPRTALELVLRLADARVTSDQRPLAHPDAITAWLDRIALALELRGATETSADLLASGLLDVDLDVAPTQELLDDLVVRALVTDTAGSVRFPANIVQEARAARAVLHAGERGKQLLGSHVLVRLPVQDGSGAPVMGVRPSWLNTLELLLGAADEQWRELVAEYDPMLAARATPADACEAERHRAIRTLWTTYVRRRVWLGRGVSGDERDDAGALRHLVAAGPPPGFIDELLAALTDGERSARANALTVLAAVLPDADLRPQVVRAVTDGDPVVRRQAASVAFEHDFTDLSDLLAAQAAVDDDELAGQTLGDFAIVLAPTDERAIELARSGLPSGRVERSWREVATRVPRAHLLDLVPGPPVESVLLDVLLDDGAVHRAPWSAQEVYRLSEILTQLPEDFAHVNGVEAVLTSHPLAALAGRLTAAPGESWWWDIGRLVQGLDPQALEDVRSLLEGDVGDLAAAAGVQLSAHPDPETLQRAKEIVTQRMQPAQDLPPRPVTPRAAHRRERVQAAAASGLGPEDMDVLLEQPATWLQSELDEPQRARLDARVAEDISDRVRGGELQYLAEQPAPFVPLRTMRALEWAAHRDLPLDAADWAGVALFALRWRDESLTQWCRQAAGPASIQDLLQLLEGQDPALVAVAHRVCPPPWPEHLISLVLGGALELGRSCEPSAQADAAAAVAARLDAGAGDFVREWLPSECPPWLRPLAVRIGDCAAEQVLLEGLLADPEGIPRWPLSQATNWVAAVSCASSAPLLEAVLRAALRAGREPTDLGELFRALDRVDGQQVLRRYDALIEDEHIPSGAFLHYQRQQALAALLEGHAQGTVNDVDSAVLRLIAATS
jgi:hypothetical protein